MAKSSHRVPSYFATMDLDVTDDATTISEQKDRKFRTDYRVWSVSEDPDERAKADALQKAWTALLKAESRDAEIDRIFGLAAANLDAVLEYSRGKRVPGPVYESLLQILVKQFHFTEDLARLRLDAYLKERGCETEVPERPKEVARLVDGFKATPLPEGVQLRWALPKEECDGVVVVRRQAGVPKSPGDGSVILGKEGPVKTENHCDTEAQLGRKYIYGIFSFYRSTPSADCRWCESYRLPPPVAPLPCRRTATGVVLSWERPEGGAKVHVFRTREPVEKIESVDGSLRTPVGGTPITECTGDACRDHGVAPGAVYHYHLVADYGDGIFSSHVSVIVPISRAQPVRELAARSHAEGPVLSWRRPRACCDKVLVVRTEGDPADPADVGTPLTTITFERESDEAVVYKDESAAPGRMYTYALFSVSEDLPATQPEICRAYRLHPAPVGFQAEFAEEGVVLTWDRLPPGAEAKLYRSPSKVDYLDVCGDALDVPADCHPLPLPEEAAAASRYGDTTFALAQRYHYLLVVRYPDGTFSHLAAAAIDTPEPLEPPRDGSVKSETRTDEAGRPQPCLRVTWIPGDPRTTQYLVYRYADGEPADLDALAPETCPKTEHLDSGVVPGRRYHYLVRAVARGLRSAPHAAGSAVALTEVTDLEATPLPGGVLLRWMAPRLADEVRIAARCVGGSETEHSFPPEQRTWLDAAREPHERVCYSVRVRFGTVWSPGKEVAASAASPFALLPAMPEPVALKEFQVRAERREDQLALWWSAPASASACLVWIPGIDRWQLVPADAGHCSLEGHPSEFDGAEVRFVGTNGSVSASAAVEGAPAASPGGGEP